VSSCVSQAPPEEMLRRIAIAHELISSVSLSVGGIG